MFFLLEIIAMACGLIHRTAKDLSTPAAQLRPNASRGAAWVGLGIGILLLGGTLFWGIAATIEDSKPHGEYGTINGIPVSREDFEKCGGKFPAGCPGGASGLLNKYEAIRRQTQ